MNAIIGRHTAIGQPVRRRVYRIGRVTCMHASYARNVYEHHAHAMGMDLYEAMSTGCGGWFIPIVCQFAAFPTGSKSF